MLLILKNLSRISNPGVLKPDDKAVQLPERVIQFGTGVLLRGLPDYYIDKANADGIFNGSVVLVKSTDSGTLEGFEARHV